jgi:hypothetical protein
MNFNDYQGTSEELRLAIAKQQGSPESVPQTDAKAEKEDKARLDYILRTRTEDVSKEDRAHLLRMLQEGLKSL